MTIVIRKAGLQTTIQSRPRTGLRHLGVPASGPADALSMALANRLVGNTSLMAALETTLTGVTLTIDSTTSVAITGGEARCTLNGAPVQQHVTISVQSGDELVIGAAEKGVRSYLAVAGGIAAGEILGSSSTYVTAGIGGHEGRALCAGDELRITPPAAPPPIIETPPEFRLPMLESWALRAGDSCESKKLTDTGNVFNNKFRIGNRNDRMGIRLDGESFAVDSDGQMPSVSVFPGVVQCTEDGSLYILSVDSGTTGGYPRVAKITRADLHLLGQLRPGNQLTLLERTDAEAEKELGQKHEYWRAWLADVADVI